MMAEIAQLITDLEAQPATPEDVPAARRRLRQLRDLLRRSDPQATCDRHWWRLQVREEQVRMLLMDYVPAMRIGAEILAAKAGPALRERVLVEADVLRCCLETQPVETTRRFMELVFAQEYYSDHGLAGHLGQVVCGLVAERRGQLDLAEEFYEKAWRTWRQVWCEPIYLQEILIRCASHAARRRAPAVLASWIGKIELHNRGYACDEFRLRFANLLAMGLRPADHETAEVIRREGASALALLHSIAERARYWEHTVELLYLLGRVGAVEIASEWDGLIPARRKFERQLWLADRAWFAACEAQNLPPPELDQCLAAMPAGGHPQERTSLPKSVRARLAAGYHTVRAIAESEDLRLQCSCRQALLGSRLKRLGEVMW